MWVPDIAQIFSTAELREGELLGALPGTQAHGESFAGPLVVPTAALRFSV
jgi:hypothetical protein